MAREKTDYLGKTLQFLQLMQTLGSFVPKPAPVYEEPPLQNTHHMEGLADHNELANYTYKKGAFYLGRIHPDHEHANHEAGVKDDRHVFIVASNAGGKGRTLIIQNALRWRGGFVALDPKGELASITAMRRGTEQDAIGTGTSVRKFIGQQVAVLDPFNQVKGASRIHKKRYNPLLDINIHAGNAQELIKKIASACIVPEEGKNAHFSDNAETIVAGVIEALKYTYPESQQTLPHLREFLLNDWEEVVLLLQDIDPNQKIDPEQAPISRGRIPKNGLASEAVNVIKKLLDTDEIGSFNSTLSRNLKWLSEPQIQDHLSRSDCSLWDLVQRQGSVYIVIPPHRMEDFRSWLRIIVQTCINAKIDLGVYQTTQETLFMLDEFPLLGRFKELEKAGGFLRGYNCKMVCAIQNIGQVKNLYRANWETFLANAGAIIGFALNDHETEQYLSNRMGKILAWETSFGTNQGASSQGMAGGINEGKSVNQQQRERDVRNPNEVHAQTARDTFRAFVIPADGKAFIIQRQNYDAIRATGLYDSPEFIRAWEKEFGGKI